MDCVGSALDELCIVDEGSGRRRMNGRRHDNDETKVFKSKNLNAERRRREKLSNRLLILRSLMNKETIITDAIDYIKKLQTKVKLLSDQLLEMESSSISEEEANPKTQEIDAEEEMKKCQIEPDVKVNYIDGNKVWIRIMFEKKRGKFSKLMEAISAFGLEVTDTSVTTSKGAILISSCVEVIYGEPLAVQEMRELLLEIIRGI